MRYTPYGVYLYVPCKRKIMSDIYSSSKRNNIMSGIKYRNTNIEVKFRKRLWSKGIRYRVNVQKMYGKPDLVLKKYRTVIFIHGCFWHGHTCKKGKLPKTRTEFWREKERNNANRDSEVSSFYEQKGWQVITIWGCEIINASVLSEAIQKVVCLLENQIEE